MGNPYYEPADFALTVVSEIDYSSRSYEFDTRVVWKDASGKLYTARDSGCSCPTPFEDFRTLESLDTFDMDALRGEVEKELRDSCSHITPLQAREFLSAVESVLPR